MEFNLAQIHEAVEAVAGDRPCIVTATRTFSYADIGERTRRLANALLERGFAVHTERSGLGNHESGQDHLGLYLHNGNEYLEGMLGGYKARAVPFNVNYRYVAEELEYLLVDSRAKGIIFHSAFAPTLAEVRDRVPGLTTLLQVRDASGNDLLPGAEWYEDALEAASPDLADDVRDAWSPDDLYMLYTGGTTGMPKGVLWRQGDIWPAALGGRKLGTSDEWPDLDAIATAASAGGAKVLPSPPFMHGAAHWLAFNSFGAGNTIVLPSVVDRLDPVDTLTTVQREGVNVLLIVGDAFARPLLDELETGKYDMSSLLLTVSGGAALSAGVKARLLAAIPTMMVMDGLGASETGQQASQIQSAGQTASTGTFSPGPGMCILSEDLSRVLAPGDDEMGWLGQQGRVPLGYLGDPDKTARTFPTIDGVRYSVPGDRARVNADGVLELLGRDSVTINSGGEKIFAEEVEAALAAHPAVFDVVVCGRPSERWGNEVVAVVQVKAGASVTAEELTAEAERHVARYKLPKAYVFRDLIQRSPSGKADYRWAKAQALAEA
ncbi:MAG: acyl-CoA synthetase [Acidimicrobiales bacterium]